MFRSEPCSNPTMALPIAQLLAAILNTNHVQQFMLMVVVAAAHSHPCRVVVEVAHPGAGAERACLVVVEEHYRTAGEKY